MEKENGEQKEYQLKEQFQRMRTYKVSKKNYESAPRAAAIEAAADVLGASGASRRALS